MSWPNTVNRLFADALPRCGISRYCYGHTRSAKYRPRSSGRGSPQSRLACTLHTPGLPVLWGATLGSQIGAAMQQVLLRWLVLTMTDSSNMVGVLFAVRSL